MPIQTRTEKKIDELREALQALQGEIKKGLLETNREIAELSSKVDSLVDAHTVSVEDGKITHRSGRTNCGLG